MVIDKQIAVLIVDDHALVLAGLEHRLQREKGFRLEGMAKDADAALAILEDRSPDVVVADLTMPGKGGLGLIREVKDRFPGVKTLALSMHGESFYAERALKNGARGYVWKQEAADELVEAIRTVASGRVFISSNLRDRLLQSLYAEDPTRSQVEQLTHREFEIFEQIGHGSTVKEIAADLHIGVKTVETHRQRIREKLGLDSSHALAHYASGWIHENQA